MNDSAFDSLQKELGSDFSPEKVLKNSPRGSVTLLRRNTDGQRFICRRFTGDGSVYCALQKADSPHLPKILRAAEQDGETLVLEQYIPGDTLFYLLQGGTLEESEAADILCQLCDGLAVLHALGAVHRDIKPENVIISGGTAVLIDFDASRLVKPENDTDTQVLGTVGYAAPEQFGVSQTDARADIYSLGVLLNIMLTGRHPAVHLTESRLRPVIETCTAVSTDRRYRDTAALITALKKTRRRFLRPVLIAAAALVLVGLFFLLKPTPSDKVSLFDGEYHLGSFTYDLDGDGEKESYRFGVISTFNPNAVEPRPYSMDIFALPTYETCSRSAAPAVWRNTTEGLTPAPEMMKLLTDVSIELVGVEQSGTETPTLVSSPAIYSQWSPAVTAYFSADTTGTWVFHAHAVLDRQPLDATGVCKQISVADFDTYYGQ